MKPLLNGEPTDTDAARTGQQVVDETCDRGYDGASSSPSGISLDGHVEASRSSSSNSIPGYDDDGESEDNPFIPNVDGPATSSWTS